MNHLKPLNIPVLPPIAQPGTDNAATPAHTPTFTTLILLPLAQNLIGGAAVAGLVAIVQIVSSRWQGALVDSESVAFWSSLAGGTVVCIATLIRFFGDDLGIIGAAYRAGQRSAQQQINTLELELQITRKQLARQLGKQNALPPARETQNSRRIYHVAEQMIRWHFEQIPIDRRSCEKRNISQGDWRRARHMLMAAGVMNEEIITTRIAAEAQSMLSEHFQKSVRLGNKVPNYVAPQ